MNADTLSDIRRDPAVFADRLLGQPLWGHQIEVARSDARYRVICAGRRAGKTRVFGVVALHRAFTVAHSRVLIISAGEVASKRMFADVAAMVQGSDLLRGSVLDETTTTLTLSNGSVLECVPSSMRQVRSAEADLLIIDEAGFVDQAIWDAAEPVILARPGSRVLMCSTPWGQSDHFFRVMWNQGMDAPSELVRSWHWPSTASPMVDAALLEQIKGQRSPDVFAREYLAEWTEASGAYFSEDELMGAVADYALVPLEELRLKDRCWAPAAGGVDWGMQRDANAIALLSLLDDQAASGDGRARLFIPYLEARTRWAWDAFIGHIVNDVMESFDVVVTASETNGVGAYPTEALGSRMDRELTRRKMSWKLRPVWTDVRRKQSGFGTLKGLLAADRLVLPRHPELLRQLRSLEFETLAGGSMRLSVPERLGHDDLAMALMQAVSCVNTHRLDGLDGLRREPRKQDVVLTGRGVAVPAKPFPVPYEWSWITAPAGAEGSTESAW